MSSHVNSRDGGLFYVHVLLNAAAADAKTPINMPSPQGVTAAKR